MKNTQDDWSEKVNIDEMKAGSKFDKMIGEDILGWYINSEEIWCDDLGSTGYWANEESRDTKSNFPVFAPSSNIKMAWLVVNFMLEYAYEFELMWEGAKEGWFCYITSPTKARTPELAICRAALKAVSKK